MSPDEYCRRVAAQSNSSFYYSFFLLPPDRRKAIVALYAYCRELDDIVDIGADIAQAQGKLDEWRHEISAMMQGRATHPITRALFPHLETCAITQEYLHALIDGMQMDLCQYSYPDFTSLARYCWHVASVVGILSARIFGAIHPQSVQYAEKLGLAFQMTNIIRDVGEDAARGRIYLPADDMAHFGVTQDDIMNRRTTSSFKELLRFQAKRTHALYAEAQAIIPPTDKKKLRPALAMTGIYHALLHKMERSGFPVLTQRVSLNPVKKLRLAWRAYRSD
ncbi:MAG: presqualene diphosphate synthase HpnD [Burkholderiaceae bacterium]|jgi:phytoene synthase|nr:presqualene diphosphate synthase HpnD [Burkholderiaceae bacterium]